MNPTSLHARKLVKLDNWVQEINFRRPLLCIKVPESDVTLTSFSPNYGRHDIFVCTQGANLMSRKGTGSFFSWYEQQSQVAMLCVIKWLKKIHTLIIHAYISFLQNKTRIYCSCLVGQGTARRLLKVSNANSYNKFIFLHICFNI